MQCLLTLLVLKNQELWPALNNIRRIIVCIIIFHSRAQTLCSYLGAQIWITSKGVPDCRTQAFNMGRWSHGCKKKKLIDEKMKRSFKSITDSGSRQHCEQWLSLYLDLKCFGQKDSFILQWINTFIETKKRAVLDTDSNRFCKVLRLSRLKLE